MDAQHGGRALDSYLEDSGSILLPSFQRVFSPPLVLFSVGPPPPAAACSWAWCRTAGERGGARQHGGEREEARRKCVFLLIKHIQMPSAVVGLLCRRQR